MKIEAEHLGDNEYIIRDMEKDYRLCRLSFYNMPDSEMKSVAKAIRNIIVKRLKL